MAPQVFLCFKMKHEVLFLCCLNIIILKLYLHNLLYINQLTLQI